MGRVTGTITLAAGAAVQVDVISFPKRTGYISEVVRAIFAMNEDNAAEADNLHVGLSIKVPARSTFKDNHSLTPDIIANSACIPLKILDSRLPIADILLQDDAVIEKELQVVLATRDGGNLAAAAKVMYIVDVEDRRETAALREIYFDRAYAQ